MEIQNNGRLAAAAAALAMFFAVMSVLPTIVWQLISVALGCISILSLSNHLATGMSGREKDDLAFKLMAPAVVFLGVIAYVTWGEFFSYVVAAIAVPLLFGISIAIERASGPVVAPAVAAPAATKEDVPPAA